MTTKKLTKQTSLSVEPLKYFKNTLFSYKIFTATLSETFRRQIILDRGKYRYRACLWAWSTISCLWAWSTISCLWELTRPKQGILLTKRTALISLSRGCTTPIVRMPAVLKAFLLITSDRVRQQSKRGTSRRDSNQGNQTWSIQVVFASIQYRISGELLCFKFPAFV